MQRDTNQSFGHVPELDGLRALAVLMVVFFHAYQHFVPAGLVDRLFGVLPARGWVGVDLFFVLSGFLITRLLLISAQRNPVRVYLSRFFARRTLRIFPPYFALLFVLFGGMALGLWGGLLVLGESTLWYWLYGSNILTAVWGFPHRALAHLWSLAVEEQFYLLWPLVALSLTKRSRWPWILGGGILLAMVSRGLLYGLGFSTQYGYVLLITRLDTLLAGAWLACLWHHRGAGFRPAERMILALVAGAILLLIAVIDGPWHWRTEGWLTQLFLLSCFAVAGVLFVDVLLARQGDSGFFIRVFRWKPMQLVGRLSYGMYLYHLPLDTVARSWGLSPVVHDWGWGLVGFQLAVYAIALAVLSFAMAGISWMILEKPILSLKRHFPVGDGRDRAVP